MLTIRLRRAGANRDPHYRVVVAESSTRRDGPFLEIVGHYHPRRQPAEIVLNMERVEAYLGQGAQMTDTVRSLCRRVARAAENVEAPAETAPATDSNDEAQLEAAAELEADSEVETQEEAAAEDADADASETENQD